MSLMSMTGYGRGVASAREDGDGALWQAELDLKSVNGRFLKLSVRTTPSLPAFEKTLETALRATICRGSVSATLQLRRQGASVPQLDGSLVRAYQAQFRRLGLDESVLPTMPGVLRSGGELNFGAFHQQLVDEALTAAVEQLVSMRRTEGAVLTGVLLRLSDRIEATVGQIASRVPLVVPAYAERLQQRVQTLLAKGGDGAVVEPAELAREIAVMADRADITEELDRLAAHIGHMRQLLREGGAVGRRIEFLAQELHREANTIGSKNIDAAIAQWVIDLKLEVERIKEQVANIE